MSLAAEFAAKIETAAAQVASRRDCAWCEVPFPLCGTALRAMTLRDYLTLIIAGNAHVTAQPVPADAVAAGRFWAAHDVQLLWLLSVDHVGRDARARDRFIARAADFCAREVRTGLNAYLQETFADARRGAGADPTQADPLKVSFFACYVHRLATAYGWTIPTIEALPLKQLFQLIRLGEVDAAYKAGKQPPLAPDETDHLWAAYLAALNASADGDVPGLSVPGSEPDNSKPKTKQPETSSSSSSPE